MSKKIISMFLTVMIFTAVSGVNAFAQTITVNERQISAKSKNEAPTGDLKAAVKSQNDSDNLNISNKSTLAEYQRAQKQGKGFSTTTKVLIGVGIAAAVVAIVVVAARNDVRNNVFR